MAGTGLLLAMAMPAAASATPLPHKCPSFTYEGITESHIVTSGVTCAFVKTFAEHFYDTLKLPKGYSIHQEHPGTPVGTDVVSYNGKQRWSFYISGHFKPDDS